MISLRYFVFILLTICLREASDFAPRLSTDRLLLCIGATTLGFGLLIKIVAYRCLYSELISSRRLGNAAAINFDRHRRQIEWIWCGAMPIILYFGDFFSWTRNFPQMGIPATAGLLFCFLPAIAFVLLVELSAAQVDQLTSHPPQREDKSGPSWLPIFWTRVRLGDTAGLVVFLLPILGVSFISESALALENVIGEIDSGVYTLAGFLALSGMLLILPHLMTVWASGQPLSEPLKDRVHLLLSRSSLKAVEGVLISSQGRWAGAAVVGWFPGFRKLWIGDGLVERLNRRQLDMVILHELAHIRRFHFVWRLIPVMATVAVVALAWAVMEAFGWKHDWWAQMATAFIAGACLILGLGWMARNCELDADRTACSMAISVTEWSADQSPADVLKEALSKLLPSPDDQKATWLHPSLAQRLGSLSRWTYGK